MDFYDKVTNLCNERGIAITTMASELGLSRSTPSNWKLRDSPPRAATVKLIADYFGVSINYFYDSEPITAVSSTKKPPFLAPVDNKYKFENIFTLTRRRLPILGEISCGKPIFCNEDKESYIVSGTNIKADFCLRAKGDSMINARIMDGDIVFVEEMPIVNNGEIGVVVIGDEATLKRVYYYPEKSKLLLCAENPKYPPLVFTDDELDGIYILGKAVAFQSDVR